jgi:peptide/nickel transport system ATP-binding protein
MHRERNKIMDQDNNSILEIEGLYVEYKSERSTARALNGVTFTLAKGESLGIVGESGAGKTTTALSILNLLPEDAAIVKKGDVRFHGKSVFKMSNRELQNMRGGKIAMIFQNPLTALNPVFTVGEQIAVVSRLHKGMSRDKSLEDAQKMLEMVGILASRVKDYPNQFSGGMRQRVGIAAALVANPEILIADEPTTALDVTIQAQILEIMKDLQKQYSTATIMITHNLGIVSELCQKVAVMYGGRIIEYGTVSEVFTNPQHPYTKGLLDALPSWEGDVKERLTAIPGLVADAQNLPSGCAFHSRCENCINICENEQPAMVRTGENHAVACCQYTEAI